jgi:hypothetical protein
MGTNFRHFKALSKKNFINWKRTPCGNCVELGTPLIIAIFLFIAGLKMQINTVSGINLSGLNHGLYPAFSQGANNSF